MKPESSAPPSEPVPVDMVLYCPQCGMQHIDKQEYQLGGGRHAVPELEVTWDNPPHKSHLCHRCGCVWRPSDTPTYGVLTAKTGGKNDTWASFHGDAAKPASPPPQVPASPLTDERIDELYRNCKAARAPMGQYNPLLHGRELARAIEAELRPPTYDAAELAAAQERGKALHAALNIEDRQPASQVVEAPNIAYAIVLLTAAAKSGDPGALSLAAQLAGVAPCEGCGFRKEFCRCTALSTQPASPAPQIAQPLDERAQAIKNQLCIDGTLNRALDEVLASFPGIGGIDAVFNILGGLAHEAVDRTIAAISVKGLTP